MGVVDDFEDQCRERGLFVVRTGQALVSVVWVGAFDVRDFGGVGQIIDDTVEDFLHADVLQC